MEAHESSRNLSRREADSNMDSRGSRVDDEEEWEGSDKRKHKSSKSRKRADSAEVEEHDSGRRKASGSRNEAKRKSGVSSRVNSEDENDYDSKRESHSKTPRKNIDKRVEKQSSDDYGERDLEGSRKRRDDENDRDSSKKTSLRSSLHESSQNKAKSKFERSYDDNIRRSQDRELRLFDKKDINKEKRDQGQHEQERSSQNRWDEVEFRRKSEESSYKDRSDSKSEKVSEGNKHGSSRDRDPDFKIESGESKSRTMEANAEKVSKPSSRDDRRDDGDRSRIYSKLATLDEDNLVNRVSHDERFDMVRDDRQKVIKEQAPGFVEDSEQNTHRHRSKSQADKYEKQRQQKDSTHGSQDEFENPMNPVDEDSRSFMWGRSGSDARRNKRSRSPEKSGRNNREYDEHDRCFQDSDNERSNSNKGKDREKEVYRNDKSSKGKDTVWNDRIRDRDSSKDQWRRTQTRQDSKEGEEFDHLMEWDVKRREHVRLGSENLHNRSAYRKDARLRPDSGRLSSAFGNRNDSSDSIEIRPNRNLDFGREDSISTFTGRKAEMGPQQEFTSTASDEEWDYPPHDRNTHRDDSQERYLDDGSLMEQSSDRNSDSQVNKGKMLRMDANFSNAGGFSNSNLQPSFGNNHVLGSFNRSQQQGPRGGRPVRGARGRMTGREAQRVGLPPPLLGPPFGHLGLPPGQLQPIGPNMNHSPVAPIGPGVFIPPFGSPLSWPGARAVDMTMLAVPPNFPPIPPTGPKGPRFPPTAIAGSSHAIYFNQPGPGRGSLPSVSSPGLSSLGQVGREMSHDKAPGGWVPPPRNNGPAGKAPSRGEQNDYSQNFVDTGMRPQNFIRELELTSVVEDYPKLRELIQRKDEIVAKSASPPMYYKCDLREFVLCSELFGTKFDVILVDPPWEEYVHRSPGITDHLEYWTFEEIMDLKIEAIADTPSFIFLWVGDGMGLEQGRQCLKKWGFRRCEDICWVKTNKKNATPGLRHDSHTLLQHSKEHCLMGIKGTVRRSTDGHIIHANIDTDIIIAEEPSDGSTKKPEDMYRIIEHFALGRRRLELFGEDHNIRAGWLTVGKGLSSSNFNAEAYTRNFSDKDGKVWQGGGGRNPPPDTPHLVVTTPEIESLRPKSPPAKNQQQPSMPLLPSSSTSIRRAPGNSPQNPMLNMDLPLDSEPTIFSPWPSSPMIGFRGPDSGLAGSNAFDNYGFNAFPQSTGDRMELTCCNEKRFL